MAANFMCSVCRTLLNVRKLEFGQELQRINEREFCVKKEKNPKKRTTTLARCSNVRTYGKARPRVRAGEVAVPEMRKRHQDVCASNNYSDLSQPIEARQKDVCHGEDQVKIAASLAAVAVMAILASSAYTAFLRVEEEKRMRRAQPLLGVAYKNSKK